MSDLANHESPTPNLMESLRADADASLDKLVSLRRQLHRNPETGLILPETQTAVLDALPREALEITVGDKLSSIVAVLHGGRQGPGVLLRADMDALPLDEKSGLAFASENAGTMHACGHDLHTAMLVGAAHLLASRRQHIAGTIVFMFQPGEEGFDGARLMIEEGVLDAGGARVRAAYGMHVKAQGIASGRFSTRAGTFMAASDSVQVTITGAGGHGASPHRAHDPVPACAAIVSALETMVTRTFNIFDPVVVTVGVLSAGTKNNIIPDTARLEATLRSFSPAARTRLQEEVRKVCEHVAAAHGVTADVTILPGYPMTINDPDHADFIAQTAGELLGEDGYVELLNPASGCEDFSRVLEEVPGAYTYLGAAVAEDPETCPDNHSRLARFDEGVLPIGAAMHSAVAIRALERLAREDAASSSV